MRLIRIAWCAIILLPCLSMPGSAQTGVQEKAAVAAAGESKLNQVGSQQELDDYQRLHGEVNPDLKRELIERFAKDYPESGLLAYVYQDGFYLGRRANDLKIMTLYGEKSLQLWPGNCTLLTELAGVYVQRNLLEEAESKAAAALALLDRASRPADIPEPQWAADKKALLSRNHDTLGFAHLRRAHLIQDTGVRRIEADDAIARFRQALEQRPVDDFAFYGLGFSGMLLNDYAMAEANLAKAVAVDGILMPNARHLLEDLYKSQHRQSLAGLEEVIAKAKKEIGFNQETAVF
jgi:tetratricopeptide (TPR) repeat protein